MPEPRSSESPKPPSWSEWKDWIGKRWSWLSPLARAEWASEWVYYGLRRLALFDLLELAGKLTIVVAIVVWFLEADQRAKQAEEAIKERHYRAWELINAARGSTGDGGRRDALQDLNKDRVSLAAAPLEQAYLPEIGLEGAELRGANLEGAHLQEANLQHAKLGGANPQNANLWRANLQGAQLTANLQGTNLSSANLEWANLSFANLEWANLSFANLGDAYFVLANLMGANLQQAVNLTQNQVEKTNGDDRTILPDGLTRPAHWSKAETTEGQPAAQPDDTERAPATAGAAGPDK